MKAFEFVARFLDVRAGWRGKPIMSLGVIKMALKQSLWLKSSTHGKCSCLSPDAFEHLSSKQREGAHIIYTHTELSVSIRICIVGPKQVIN